MIHHRVAVLNRFAVSVMFVAFVAAEIYVLGNFVA